MPEDVITLYPSSWLYNAGVIGFLEVLEMCGETVENLLRDDGTVEISTFPESSEIFDKWDEITEEKIKKSFKNKKGGTKDCYYANQTEQSIKKMIEKLLNNQRKNGKQNLLYSCVFCGRSSYIKISEITTMSQKFSKILLTAERTFPNSYWNNISNVIVCPKCEFIIICHHIPMIKVTQEGEIFINAPSFKIMWYLNKFAEKVLTKSKEHELRKILALSLIEFAQKVSVTLGAWSIMNIEMIIKKSKRIDYYCLPYEISKVLLQRDIATLISETKEPIVLETVLNGKFDYLLTLNHKILRSLTSGSDTTKDNSLSELINKDASNLRSLSRILPELYAKIDYTIKKG